MSSPLPGVLTDDARYAAWAERIHEIEQQTTSLFWNRRLFRAVARMFDANVQLRDAGGHVWEWVAGTYGRDAVMAVRRELDGQARVLNLYHLLHEMEDHAAVLTRRRYHAFFSALAWFPAADIDRQFERFGGAPGPGMLDDHIPAAVIRGDREQLEANTEVVVAYANRLVAHRTPAGELPLSLRQVDDAVRAVFDCLRKYYVLLTGRALTTATPVPLFDWLAPFKIVWITPEYQPPDDE